MYFFDPPDLFGIIRAVMFMVVAYMTRYITLRGDRLLNLLGESEERLWTSGYFDFMIQAPSQSSPGGLSLRYSHRSIYMRQSFSSS